MPRKTITIHQPDFLPWLGFFDRWIKSDLFIILDDVQFLRRGWHHRDKIKTPSGIKWLTVPIIKKGQYYQKINETKIDSSRDWTADHLNLIYTAYKKAPQFDSVYSEIKAVYSKKTDKLIDLNLNFLFFVAERLNIKTPVAFSSEYNTGLKGTERLVKLVKETNGQNYLTGTGSKAYLDEDLFSKENINVVWQQFSVPSYPQLYNSFEPGLSIIDLLMMLPANKIQQLLKGHTANVDMQV